MIRSQLLESLKTYQTTFDTEISFIPRFKSLLVNFENCYERRLLSGHITASAWIVDEMGGSALLVHHKKLHKWLQPGGHADGDENVISVAMKEAQEETGLKSLCFLHANIFDVDIHLIPQHKTINTHFHYDIRFVFTADSNETLVVSDESNSLQWFPLDEIHKVAGNNNSIHRMVLKTKFIFK